MAWFLALQGPPNRVGQSLTYELHESANIEQIAQEMSASATIDRAVPIPTVFRNRPEPVMLYVRPTAWGLWGFYEMTEEERREMAAASPQLVNALAQVAKQQQQQQAKKPKGPQGPSELPRLHGGQQPFLVNKQD